ncbi:MAG: hypothetical protein LBI56_02115 [Puniceicoccales bacterium]|jgi:hypothetical protein|nr:hypothetical protein [Puniceicoccales bacterium]
MKITTSDGVSIIRFEKIPEIAGKLLDTKTLSDIKPNGDKEIKYGNRTIPINDSKELTGFVPTLLDDMSIYNWTGKIYAKDGSFTDYFAKSLYCLLTWFSKIGKSANGKSVDVEITGLQLEDALRWLVPMIKTLQGCSRTKSSAGIKLPSVEGIIERMSQSIIEKLSRKDMKSE